MKININQKMIDVIFGAIPATVMLIYPGFFALLWDFSFWLVHSGENHFANVSILKGVAIYVMAFLFPIGCAGVHSLWYLALNKCTSNRQIVYFIFILLLAEVISVWIFWGMPGFQNNDIKMSPWILQVILLGPMAIGMKHLYVLMKAYKSQII